MYGMEGPKYDISMLDQHIGEQTHLCTLGMFVLLLTGSTSKCVLSFASPLYINKKHYDI